ncbi:hypothetical protein BaRGS_00028909 [Batillaria attramentaria]|uniref:Uncharacterized protein n=1 Tax=Batillaria attramentaria TaxID=370345 RepID=A0ABD0JYK2_9CAEN
MGLRASLGQPISAGWAVPENRLEGKITTPRRGERKVRGSELGKWTTIDDTQDPHQSITGSRSWCAISIASLISHDVCGDSSVGPSDLWHFTFSRSWTILCG